MQCVAVFPTPLLLYYLYISLNLFHTSTINQSFPFVLSQGTDELAASRRRRKLRAPPGTPGTFDGGSVFVRPSAACSEPHIDWSLTRPSLPDTSLAAVAAAHNHHVVAPRRVSTVDYRQLATVGKRG